MAKSPRCSRNITLLNPSRPRPGRSAARQVNPPCPRLLVAGACTSWRSLAVHLVRMGGIKRPGEPGADEVGLVESTSQGTSKRLRQSPPTSPCTGAQPAGVCPICRCLLVQKCERVALARLPPPAPRSSASALLFLLLAPALPRPTGNQCRSTGMQVSPCMLSFGGCGCVYHEHCVSHWLLKRNVCPVHESP